MKRFSLRETPFSCVQSQRTSPRQATSEEGSGVQASLRFLSDRDVWRIPEPHGFHVVR